MKGSSNCAITVVSTESIVNQFSWDAAHGAGICRQGIQQIAHCLMQHRMLYVRRDLRQWLKDKAALLQSGMRNGQCRGIQHRIAKEKYVNVNRPWPLRLRTFSSHD